MDIGYRYWREKAMTSIGKADWGRVKPVLDQLLDMDENSRSVRLEDIRRDDPALATQIDGLFERKRLADRDGFLQGDLSTQTSELDQSINLQGKVVHGYTVDRPIDQGGMGSVWLAHRSDGRYEGKVAIKFLNLAMMTRGGSERFQREGNFLARLTHANIARLIDAGVAAGGQPYLILEYVEGESIDRWCDAKTLDIDARIRLFLKVLDTVAHAHNNLVLHRDLKPSNILVTRDGDIKLLDFGIAKLLTDDATIGDATELTQLVGRAFTPEYAAPEQVQGQEVSIATDVYSLGVLLYVLLGGLHPTSADGTTPVQRLQAVVETEPPRLSDAIARYTSKHNPAIRSVAEKRGANVHKLVRSVQGDLDNIVAKALKKTPSERYTNVNAFADDLKRYLHHEPVSARADQLRYRAEKFMRRHRLGVAVASMMLLTLTAALAGTTWQAIEARKAREIAVAQAERAGGINRLLSVVLSEVSSSSASFTTAELLARAERWADKLYARDPRLHAEVLLVLGDRVDHQDGGRALAWYEKALALTLPLSEPKLKAAAACKVAVKLAHTGTDVPRANKLIDASIVSLASFPVGTAARTGCLGSATYAAIQRGDTAAAVMLAEQTKHEAEHETGPALDRLAGPVGILASAYTNDGQYAAAKRAHDESIAILHESGLGESVRMATVLNNAGVNLLQAGAPREALTLLGQALAIDSINTHASYAAALLQLGRTAEAVTLLDLTVEEARRQSNPVSLGRALLHASRAHLQSGDMTGATSLANEAATSINSTLPPRHVGRATLLTQQGRLAMAYGDTQKARDLLMESIAVFEAASPRSSDRVLALVALADVHRVRGEPVEAMRRAEDALALARKVSGDMVFSYRIGVAALAVCEAEQANRSANALKMCDLAIAQLAGSVGDDAPSTQQARSIRTRL
jgi:eukaryotic-like serine/threonine-protein kinase